MLLIGTYNLLEGTFEWDFETFNNRDNAGDLEVFWKGHGMGLAKLQRGQSMDYINIRIYSTQMSNDKPSAMLV